jgi:hypothetical protein
MTTVWAIPCGTFYLALLLSGWVRVDNYVNGHGFQRRCFWAAGQKVGNRTMLFAAARRAQPKGRNLVIKRGSGDWVGRDSYSFQ